MVVDVAAVDVAPAVRGVEAVALGQELFERPGPALGRLPHGAVAGSELRPRRPPVGAQAPVAYLVSLTATGHLGVEVRQAEGGAGEADGHRACGVQREEPDAGLAPGRDVGADIQLREVREGGDARQEAWAHAAHAKRRDAQPGAAVEGVEAEGGWYETPERLLRDGPVREEEVVPAHKEQPRARGKGIWPVPRPAQDLLG